MRSLHVRFAATASVAMLFVMSIVSGTQTQAQPSIQVAATLPASPPLTLLWQTGATHDDILIGANFITVDDQGNCYVGSSIGYPVKEFDANGKFVMAFGSQGTGDGQFTFETGVAVDTQRNLFVADFSDFPRIEKFHKNGTFLTKWATEPPTGPAGIGVDSQGNVYVGNHRTHDHYIQKFDNTGHLLTEWGTTGTGEGQFSAGSHSGIEGLTLDKQDNVYVTDPINHRIQKFDSNGNFLAQFGSAGFQGSGHFANPFAVAVNAQGNIYVNDGNFLQELDPNGKFLAQWPTTLANAGNLDGANSIAVDHQGDIYTIAYADVTGVNGGTYNITVLKKFRQPVGSGGTVVPTAAPTSSQS